jgi:hypothetical protein
MEKALNIAGYNCPALHFEADGTPIVFLHGMSYTNQIWQEIGVTEFLIQKHVTFLALDMPYGIKSRCHPKTRNVQKNVKVINEAIKTVLGGSITDSGRRQHRRQHGTPVCSAVSSKRIVINWSCKRT